MANEWTGEDKIANRIMSYIAFASHRLEMWRDGEMIPSIMNDFRLSIDEMIFSMLAFPDDFPDTPVISRWGFMRQLFSAGAVFITDKADFVDSAIEPGYPRLEGVETGTGAKLSAWTGALGGATPAFLPTYITVASPYLKTSYVWSLFDDGVLVRCGPAMRGFGDTVDKWAYLYAQSIVTMCADVIQSRAMTIIHAQDDNAATAADKFYTSLWKGEQKPLKTTGTRWENPDYNPISTFPVSTAAGQLLVSVIEMHQYIVSQCLHEIGIQSPQSMKREAINGSEAGMNVASLTPRPNAIIECIKEDGKKIFDRWGVRWVMDIELGDAWAREKKAAEAAANPEPSAEPTADPTPTPEGDEEDEPVETTE